jgi:hypothetical protein
MPRYSVTVTVRLDAESEGEASDRVTDALSFGSGQKGGAVGDFFTFAVDDVENEDEMQAEQEG